MRDKGHQVCSTRLITLQSPPMDKIPGPAWEAMHRDLEALVAQHNVFEGISPGKIGEVNEIIGTLRALIVNLFKSVKSLRGSSETFGELADHDSMTVLGEYEIWVSEFMSKKKKVKPILDLCRDCLGKPPEFYDEVFRKTLFAEAEIFCQGPGGKESMSEALALCLKRLGQTQRDMEDLRGDVAEEKGTTPPRQVIEEYFGLPPIEAYVDQTSQYDRLYELAIAYCLDESDAPVISDELKVYLEIVDSDERALAFFRQEWRDIIKTVTSTRTKLSTALWVSHHALESSEFHVEGHALEATSHDVSRLVFEGEVALRNAFGEQNIVNFDIQQGLEARIHPGTIVTLLFNMVRNARKHGRADVLKITLKEGTEPDILTLEVEDNGSGVTVSPPEKVFEEGFSGGGSTGIGLGLARERLACMEATIAFEPHGGIKNGAKFTMKLKRAVAAYRAM